jgi:hypothetical protein
MPKEPQATRKEAGTDQPQSAEYLAEAVRTPARDISADDSKKVVIGFQLREPVDQDQADLWNAIRQHTEQIGFNHFASFVESALCRSKDGTPEPQATDGFGDSAALRVETLKFLKPCSPGGYIPGVALYDVLKLASEVFLLLRCGVCPQRPRDVIGSGTGEPPDDIFGTSNGALTDDELDELHKALTAFLGNDRGSYIRAIIRNVFSDAGFKSSPFCPVSVGLGPCLLELIWSYWHEEGMLVQTSNAIALRFQNVSRGPRDPLAEFELDPLRPLSGFMWGYIQDENSRLSVARRAYEYHHHYGLSLAGKATARVRPADTRSKFLQAFHDLLRLTDLFYREAADNTVTPDPFPLLIALRDLHLILSEGAHNQFRDLPWTARSEMLVQQWLLARQETREFLHGRQMVPYPEAWMGTVDAMKRLQGWSDTNVIHFFDLARFGERILLSIRHVRWDAVGDPMAAQDWALSWRPEIQGYIHAYRMVTGVALSDDVVEVNRPGAPRYVQPAVLLQARLRDQRSGALPAGTGVARPTFPARTRSLPRRP